MKYEFRKMRTVLLFLSAALAVLEIGFIIGDKIDDFRVAGVCLWLLISLTFGAYVYILISGIVSYSHELSGKTGYMAFMTPVSPMGIVSSKLLFTALVALVSTAAFGGAAYYDVSRTIIRFDLAPEDLRQLQLAFSIFQQSSGIDVIRVAVNIASTVAGVLIEIMLVVCTAYLAITLSATLLQNKRGFLRVLLTLTFFVALNFGLDRIHELALLRVEAESVEAAARLLGRQAIIDFGFCVLFAGLSALLLDRKVSL